MATLRRPTATRREEIAKAILTIIGRRGLGALSTTTLAGEIGFTSGALFRHFASRDAMLDGAVRYALVRIEGTFPDESLPPLERLLGLARRRVNLLASEPGIAWLLRSEQAYLSLPDGAVASLREAAARSRSYLVKAIRDGVAAGSIRDDIDPEILVVPVMGTIHALAGMSGVHGRATARRRAIADDVLSALERMLAPPAKTPGAAKNQPKQPRRKS